MVLGFCFEKSGRTLSAGTNNTLTYGAILVSGSAFEIGGTNYTASLASPGSYTASMVITSGSLGGFMQAVSIKTAAPAGSHPIMG